jgi:hypothetical protein
MIVGLGKAAELVIKNLNKYSSHMREIRDYLEKCLEVINSIIFIESNIDFNLIVIRKNSVAKI